jgi:hypothetical protein
MKPKLQQVSYWWIQAEGKKQRFVRFDALIDLALKEGMAPPFDYVFEHHKVVGWLRKKGFEVGHFYRKEEVDEDYD